MSATATDLAQGAGSEVKQEHDSAFAAAISSSSIFPRNGPDSSARSWGHKQGGLTFGAQHKLPKLPLPSLESSCKRYLEALKPLSTQGEFEASSAAVQSFLDGDGPILQAQLEAYNAQQDNWFENFGKQCLTRADKQKVHLEVDCGYRL